MCDYLIMLERVHNPQCLKLFSLKETSDMHDEDLIKEKQVIIEEEKEQTSSEASQLEEDALRPNQIVNR